MIGSVFPAGNSITKNIEKWKHSERTLWKDSRVVRYLDFQVFAAVPDAHAMCKRIMISLTPSSRFSNNHPHLNYSFYNIMN